ncbi:MAG: hypothetical protein ACYDAC_10330 [Candidatus Dormibacteria bacterium]
MLLRTRTPGCTVAVDHPALPASLSALGDFQQPYSAGSPAILEDVAQRAASASSPALIGGAPQPPVMVAGAAGRPAALVVALRATGAGSAPPIIALASFEVDCAGNAYFQQVEDDVSLHPPLLAFPPVDRATAAARLGTSEVRLVWSRSPLYPVWETAGASPASLAAR